MALSPEQLALRHGKVTASFIPKLMAGDEAAILREWMRLTEHPDYTPEDLSDVWAVQFGSWVEEFALDWHQRKTGCTLADRGVVVTHPTLPHICCTLDAMRYDDMAVIDVKAANAHRKIPDLCAYYAPQMIVQRGCTGAAMMALLIVHGGTEPQEWPIEVEPEYEALVWERIAGFWRCVEELTPPFAMAPAAAPVIEAFREIDMDGNNEFASLAADWLYHRDAAKKFETAVKDLKQLTPADAKRCYGYGVSVNRAKNGALTIKGE